MGEVEEGGKRWMSLSVVVFLGFLRMGIVWEEMGGGSFEGHGVEIKTPTSGTVLVA